MAPSLSMAVKPMLGLHFYFLFVVANGPGRPSATCPFINFREFRMNEPKEKSPIRNANTEHKEKMTRMDRVALWSTNRVGTMGFFLLIVVWTVLWLGWNIFSPKSLQFDPYPAFVLWLFISNMIQIFLMPLILVGQNLQGRHAEIRAEADFDVNVKAETEIESILKHLESQDEMILKILHRLETNKTA